MKTGAWCRMRLRGGRYRIGWRNERTVSPASLTKVCKMSPITMADSFALSGRNMKYRGIELERLKQQLRDMEKKNEGRRLPWSPRREYMLTEILQSRWTTRTVSGRNSLSRTSFTTTAVMNYYNSGQIASIISGIRHQIHADIPVQARQPRSIRRLWSTTKN